MYRLLILLRDIVIATIDLSYVIHLSCMLWMQVMNAQLPQNSRRHVIDQFNRGVVDIVIATDAAASVSQDAEEEEEDAEEGGQGEDEEDEAAGDGDSDGMDAEEEDSDISGDEKDAEEEAPESKKRSATEELGSSE